MNCRSLLGNAFLAEVQDARSSKEDRFPTWQVRRYLEPGPIVLVSCACDGRTNIMTMGWQTVMEFTPSLVGCVISNANHSFGMIERSRECVINLPTTKLTDIVVGIGNTTGAEIDKFRTFRAPCLRGLRIRVGDILALLASGASWQDIEDYTELESGDIAAALEYAARASDHVALRLAGCASSSSPLTVFPLVNSVGWF